MNLKAFLLAPLAVALLIVAGAGCATVENRIDQNRDYFDSLPVAAQARIRGGQVDLGFNRRMVEIAMGKPQRRLERRSAEETIEVWLYLDADRRYERQRVELDTVGVSGSSSARIGGSAWMNVLQEREFVRNRIEFRNDTVCAIETRIDGAAAGSGSTSASAPPAAP